MIPLLEGALVGYALGSFPTAYLLVRWQTGLDIRQEGSGNVGGRNAYEVTGSRAIGLLTGLGDALKGLLALLVAGLLWRGDPNVLWASAVGSVAGHNYNLWLSLGAGRLSGGKGLATAGAILLLLAPWVVLAWCLLWWASYRFWLRDINRANIVATLWVGLLGGWPCGVEAALALGILSALVLGKHLPDARRWWAELKA